MRYRFSKYFSRSPHLPFSGYLQFHVSLNFSKLSDCRVIYCLNKICLSRCLLSFPVVYGIFLWMFVSKHYIYFKGESLIQTGSEQTSSFEKLIFLSALLVSSSSLHDVHSHFLRRLASFFSDESNIAIYFSSYIKNPYSFFSPHHSSVVTVLSSTVSYVFEGNGNFKSSLSFTTFFVM